MALEYVMFCARIQAVSKRSRCKCNCILAATTQLYSPASLSHILRGLLDFAGSAIVVSHDRYFLDRVATHILACEGDSEWHFFPGNYADYEENKKERLGETSLARIKYAPLVNA